MLESRGIGAHIIRAVEEAFVRTEPTTHAVVEQILPPDFYELVSAAIPPAELFPTRDPIKQDFHLDEHLDGARCWHSAYQFYVKPRDGDLMKLLLELPVDVRRNWAQFLDDK